MTHACTNLGHFTLLRCRVFRIIPLIIFSLHSNAAVAATLTWKGGHATSANWNLRDNWVGGVVPGHGDTLVFPAASPRRTNTNNILGLRLNAIEFTGAGGGYVLRGGSLTLSNGIVVPANGDSTVAVASISLGANQEFEVAPGAELKVSSDISLKGFDLTVGAVGDVILSGSIQGIGDVTKSGMGQLMLSGPDDNTFDGRFFVNTGLLLMNKWEITNPMPLTFAPRIAIPGDLHLGNGTTGDTARATFDHQIANSSTVRIALGATLDLNGHDEAIGGLVMTGGTVQTGNGLLTLNSNVTVNGHATGSVISGNLGLARNTTFTVGDGDAAIDLDVQADIVALTGIIKEGPGSMRLRGTNGYFGSTLVNAGLLRVGNDSALGSPNSGTTVKAGAELFIEPAVNSLREPLTLAGAGIGGATGAIRIGSGATVATNVVLSGPTTIYTQLGGNLSIDGVISGTGPLRKIGPGTLELEGKSPNSYSGSTVVESGLLVLNKSLGVAVPGDLVIGTTESTATVRHSRSGNVGGGVVVNANSLYDLNSNNESIDNLTFVGGGQVQTDSGLLTVDDDIVVQSAPIQVLDNATIIGRLRLGSGGTSHIHATTSPGSPADFVQLIIGAHISGTDPIVKDGPGLVTFVVSNSFTGPLTVSDGRLNVYDGHALGSTDGDTFIENNASLALLGDSTFEERLFLNSTHGGGYTFPGALLGTGTNHWTGPIFLSRTAEIQVTTNAVLDISGFINGLGGLTKLGEGRLTFSGTRSNTYLGKTTVNAGSLRLERSAALGLSVPGDMVIGDGSGIDLVEVRTGSGQIDDRAAVTVNDSGWLFVEPAEMVGQLTGSGHVHLLPSSELILGGHTSTVFTGVISGAGRLVKFGDGMFTLTGDNTYTGDTVVVNGVMTINGSQPGSAVLVSSGSTLRGGGEVGDLTVQGTLAPGDPFGYLRAKSVDMAPNSHLALHIQGSGSDTGYNWIYSTGSVDVADAVLDVSMDWAPYTGQTFFVAGYQSLTGKFKGLAQGAVIVVNHIPLRLDYSDETGHRVALTVGDLALRLESTRVDGGNGNGGIDPDECNDLWVAIENPTAGGVEVLSAYLESVDSRLIVTHSEGFYGLLPAGGVRTNRVAFQVRSSSDSICGVPARFQLVVETLAHGRFAIPVTLPTGSPGTARSYANSDGVTIIPDLGGLNSQVSVDESFVISKARVSVHAFHPSVGQLRLRLFAPGGHEVLLVANRGGTGNDFGLNCARRTIFDDDATTSIASPAAEAPFHGTFTPEGHLADLIGVPSAGTWTLRVEDTVAGGLGALQCWTLELSPAECSPGGGGCSSCLAAIAGSLKDASSQMPHRLNATAYETGCGNADPCPGLSGSGTAPFRFATHTFTNNGPDTCVTLALSVPCIKANAGLQLSAYLKEFNPESLCHNLIGFSGFAAVNGLRGCSFLVPAGQRFTVVVNEVNEDGAFQGCDDYRLEVYGLPCPQEQPRLDIAHDAGPDHVRLHWSTAYPGFQLQGKSSLGVPEMLSPIYTNVLIAPTVQDGEYSVTNLSRGNSGFFRLRKP